jgi:hydroxypyruvate reductase/glycerate 2-kinase
VAVLNRDQLLGHGEVDLRRVALQVLERGWVAADPARGTRHVLSLRGDALECAGRSFDLRQYRQVLFAGCGKASLGIASAVEEVLGQRLSDGVVIVPRGGSHPLQRITVLESDHPLPTAASIDAGRELLQIADATGPDDLLIAAITGGSSSLACAPPPGVSVADLSHLYQLLLSSGADIADINTVRRHVSEIKGGRLALRAGPAALLNLTVSDVVGDRLELISDLTVQNHANAAAARAVLKRLRLWRRIPAPIRDHLTSIGDCELPNLDHLDITSQFVLTSVDICDAMAREAAAAGFAPVILGTTIQGESRGVGSLLGSLAMESWRHQRPFPTPCALIASGGETTVTLPRRSRWRAGGPNQELAVAFAQKLAGGIHAVVAAVDSDGQDGSTDLAGAVVEGSTCARAGLLHVDLPRALREHTTRDALSQLDDGVVTGPTGTNINDILVVLVAGSPLSMS